MIHPILPSQSVSHKSFIESIPRSLAQQKPNEMPFNFDVLYQNPQTSQISKISVSCVCYTSDHTIMFYYNPCRGTHFELGSETCKVLKDKVTIVWVAMLYLLNQTQESLPCAKLRLFVSGSHIITCLKSFTHREIVWLSMQILETSKKITFMGAQEENSSSKAVLKLCIIPDERQFFDTKYLV